MELLQCVVIILCTVSMYFLEGQVVYNGPASNVYFHSEFDQTQTLQTLSCGSYQVGETNPSNPVSYYAFVKSTLMNNYRIALRLSTCCEFARCNDLTCNFDRFGDITGYEVSTEVNCAYATDATAHRGYCEMGINGSMDTILYMLYEKDSQINLVGYNDDSPSGVCSNTQKSYIDLYDFGDKAYIVGVGGYKNQTGRFFVHIDCEQYSYPATAIQMNPQYNLYARRLDCGYWPSNKEGYIGRQPVYDDLVRDNMKYYMFTVGSYVYLPVVITICIQLEDAGCGVNGFNEFYAFLIRKDESPNAEPNSFEILNSVGSGYSSWVNGDNGACDLYHYYDYYYPDYNYDVMDGVNLNIRLTSKDIYSEGTYYVAIQSSEENKNLPPTSPEPVIIYTICNEAPTPIPTMQPSLLPTLHPTNDPTIEPTSVPSKEPSIDPTMQPTTSPTTTPTKDPTTEPTSDPTAIPTKDPTTEPTSDPTTTPTKDPTTEPTSDPTAIPTKDPTTEPTSDPTTTPTKDPTTEPTSDPTVIPTKDPTLEPTHDPTKYPSMIPSHPPTVSPTLEYSFPIDQEEFEIVGSLPYIQYVSCGTILHGQQNTYDNLVSYIKFTVTSKEFYPTYVSTCFSDDKNEFNYTEYETVLYILDADNKLIDHSSACIMYPCTCEQSQMEVSSLPNGNYTISVQGYQNKPGHFSINMKCTEPPPKVPKEVVMCLVLGFSGAVLIVFIIYYLYHCKKYYDSKPTSKHKAVGTQRSNTQIEMTHQTVPSQSTKIVPTAGIAKSKGDDDDSKSELGSDVTEEKEIQLFFKENEMECFYNEAQLRELRIISLTNLCQINDKALDSLGMNKSEDRNTFLKCINKLSLRLFLERDMDENLSGYYPNFVDNGFTRLAQFAKIQDFQLFQLGITNESHQIKILNAVQPYTVSPGDPRRIDGDKTLYDQLAPKEDVVQRVIAHAIQCCDDQSGFDIYQVLAIRYYDAESRNARPSRPFSKIGIYTEFVSFPPFLQTLMIAIIAGFAQTVGISIVIYKLLMSYFVNGEIGIEGICAMDASRWSEVYSLRMLSFVFSLVITFYVSSVMNAIEHSGLYEILNRLKLEHINKIDDIVLELLYIGHTINYFVCLLAVIGSYFIVFETNRVDPDDEGFVDYSHSGLDMILNAVALFFMLELDDLMVSSQAYGDCKQHLEKLLDEKYMSDNQINKEYLDNEKNSVCCNDISNVSVNVTCCSKLMYRFGIIFSLFVKVCCYVFGFIAPFVIFFCW
eukprot:230164_1